MLKYIICAEADLFQNAPLPNSVERRCSMCDCLIIAERRFGDTGEHVFVCIRCALKAHRENSISFDKDAEELIKKLTQIIK